VGSDPFSPEFWKAYQKRFHTEEDELFLKPDFWDQMAESYDDLEATPFYREMVETVISEMEAAGALAPEITLLDLCCGTGSYTVRFARRVKEVWALDISPGMLRVLERKIEDQGLKNVRPVLADWRLYSPPRKFETVFVSMTPILNDLEEFDRILGITERYLAIVQWAGLRENDLYREVLKRFFNRSPRKRGPGAVVLFNYLFSLGYPAEIRFFSGIWERARPLEKELKRLLFKIRGAGLYVDSRKENEIRTFLSERARDGKVISYTRVRIAFVFADLKKEALAFA